MPITLPDRVFFDPYHESGIIITHTPGRILFQFPRPSAPQLLHAYILASLSIAAGITAPFWPATSPARIAAALALPAVGLLLFLCVRLVRSVFTQIELTPEELIFSTRVPLGDPVTKHIPWTQIDHVSIGPVYKAMALFLHAPDGTTHTILKAHPIGELERFESLLKSLLPNTSPQKSP